jgi:hypothetical protein
MTQNEPDKGQSKQYSPSDAMLMARLMYDLNTRAVREGASFAQQYLLNKGRVHSTVPTQQRTKDLRTEGARFLKERNGPTTPKELLYSKINRRYDSDRTKKGAASPDVPGSKAMRNR